MGWWAEPGQVHCPASAQLAQHQQAPRQPAAKRPWHVVAHMVQGLGLPWPWQDWPGWAGVATHGRPLAGLGLAAALAAALMQLQAAAAVARQRPSLAAAPLLPAAAGKLQMPGWGAGPPQIGCC